MRKTKIPKEKWIEAEKWKAGGVSAAHIAERLGVSKSVVSKNLGKRRPK